MQARPSPPASLPQHCHSPPRIRRSAAAGFSLVEWLVVVAIVAVLASLALPSMQQLVRRRQVRVVAEDLLADLNWARSEAVRHGMAVAFRFGDASSGWKILLSADGACKLAGGETEMRRYQLPAGVALPDNYPQTLCFHPQDTVTDRLGHFLVRPVGAADGDLANRVLCLSLGARIRMERADKCQ